MFPDQSDWLYIACIMVGVVVCIFFVLPAVLKRYGGDKKTEYYFSIWAIISIAAGFGGAILFYLIYDLFKYNFKLPAGYSPGMTFLGGLIVGVAAFLLLVKLWGKKHPDVKSKVWIIFRAVAPCVLIAHAFGRIGCFCAGCCYGQEISGFPGIVFPAGSEPASALNGGEAVKVIPTQLIEAIFLFALFALCFHKKFTDKSAIIYLFGYGIFRFVIEFFRADPRGAFLFGALSPSQVICIGMLIIGAGLLYLDIKKGIFKKHVPPEQPQAPPANA